jgi:hypothetical protein
VVGAETLAVPDEQVSAPVEEYVTKLIVAVPAVAPQVLLRRKQWVPFVDEISSSKSCEEYGAESETGFTICQSLVP